jgi:hypothetical protein
MDIDLDFLMAQAEQVNERSKERYNRKEVSNYIPAPAYDIQIPKWGASKKFKYSLSTGEKIEGTRLLVVILGAKSGFIRWGNREHDRKKGPVCQSRGYHNPVTGERVNERNWELGRASVGDTIRDFKPFGSRKDEETGEFLSCETCIAQGLNKSDIPNSFNGVDRCDMDNYLEVAIFKHMVETDEGVLFKTVTNDEPYLAKLPMTGKAHAAFLDYVFGLARNKKLTYSSIVTEIKIEETRNKAGSLVGTLDFFDKNPDSKGFITAVNEAKLLYANRLEKSKAEYEAKRSQKNPVSKSSANINPF